VELALRRLRTDVIDVLHFHSCPVDVLERPGLVDALTRAVEQGKVRVAAYSGDNAALEHAIGSSRFGAVQVSVNLFDQRAVERGVRWAEERGMGVIAKRPLGNAPWRFHERPQAGDIALYWERMRSMGLDPRGLDWSELALRFAAFVPGVSTCIVGTSRVENLQRNLRALERGPLPPEVVSGIREAFRSHDAGWDGQI
jgi:aryl-alcohol dehydrogenase-like predicted oxidoreductase